MADAVTRDAFYGGRLVLTQPAKGHRSGTDAVLLAAAVPRDFAGLCCDVGAGIGAAGLGVALACPVARVRLLEVDPVAAALAAANIDDNGLGDRVEVSARDLFDPGVRRAATPADLIVTNPPFHAPGRVRASPDDARRAAHVLAPGTTLADWIVACLALLAPKGTIIVMHVASALPDILAAMEPRLGGVTMLAIHPRVGAPANRLLVRGTAGSRAPFAVAPPLVLHQGDDLTEEASRFHRGEVGLAW